MPTFSQLTRPCRLRKVHKKRSPALKGRPHLKGIVQKVHIRKPKKPNSARRQCAKIKLSTGRFLNVYIPGIGHDLKKFSEVQIRGGGVPDLPGIRYHAIRGMCDFRGPEKFIRSARRSKFGKKNPFKKHD